MAYDKHYQIQLSHFLQHGVHFEYLAGRFVEVKFVRAETSLSFRE